MRAARKMRNSARSRSRIRCFARPPGSAATLNWGRVVAALGYSGAKFKPEKVDVFYDGVPGRAEGGDAGTPESDLVDIVRKREFTVSVDLHDGDESYWVWTNDISYEYVKINADYHT